MRLLLVHPGRSLASTRIRVLRMAPHLEALGAEVSCVEFPDGTRARLRLAREMERHDAVLMHLRLPSPLDGWSWRSVDTPLVFDFDDAVRFRQRPRRGSFESWTRRTRFARAVAVADAFTCGNRYLRELVAPSGKPACIVPSPVPLDVPRRPAQEVDGPPRIGWIGGRGNLADLAALAEPLRALAAERRFVLTVVSDEGLALPGVEVEHVPWTLAGQEAALARLDVGLMPLADTPWNRGKGAYKLLQYMAAEVAAVGSPVGMNAELIRDGENGRLAADPDAWRTTLAELLDDAAERARLARAGRETVEREYGYETTARRLLDFLERVAAG